MPEKPKNFWQELKRRKVFRVIAMYAAAAYVIIELSNNIVEPLRLPEWVPTLIIVLLAIGFPFAVIFSWIFDVTSKGIQKTKPAYSTEKREAVKRPSTRKLRASDIIIAVLLVAVIILVYPKIFKTNKIEQLRSEDEITIAVMPFQNMTGDATKDFWQEMVQDNLITSLSNTEELIIRQPESISILLQNTDIDNYASITPSIAKNVSRKLQAGVYVSGSINRAGETIRISAKLVDSETEEVFKSFKIEGVSDSIIYLADSLSAVIKDYFIITILQNEAPPDRHTFYGSTKSPEALRYLLEGRKAFYKKDYVAAIEMLNRAIEIDSNYFSAIRLLAIAYSNARLYEDAKKWCLKIYKQKDRMSRIEELIIEYQHAFLFQTPNEEIKYLKQILAIDDQQATYYYNLGRAYNSINQFKRAIPELEKVLQLYKKWDIKPSWIYHYAVLGRAYYRTEQYKKLKKLCRQTKRDFPGDPILFSMQAVLALKQDRAMQANEFLKKFIKALEERSYTETYIATNLGNIHLMSELTDKAEEYYRQALSLEPGSAMMQNSLAYFLIDEERNINEGLHLVDKALESEPGNYDYLYTKGWGLYKQGKYNEAFNVLQESWDLRMANARYNHEAFLHLEAAKKAVAGN